MTARLVVRFAGIGWLLLGVATDVAAQAAIADAWSRVPASPTTCYRDDGFVERVDSASAVIKAEIERQQKVNSDVTRQFDNMDMMEKAQRMQAYMMRNPEAAARLLEAQQAVGASSAAALPELEETAARLGADLDRLQAAFQAAAEQAVTPIRDTRTRLIETKAAGVDPSVWFPAAADHAQYLQLIADENAAYERACAPYYGPGGSLHDWLMRYRAEITERVIALSEGDFMVVQLQALGMSGAGYRSTEPLEQVDLYLRQVRTVFQPRWYRVKPTIEPRRN